MSDDVHESRLDSISNELRQIDDRIVGMDAKIDNIVWVLTEIAKHIHGENDRKIYSSGKNYPPLGSSISHFKFYHNDAED